MANIYTYRLAAVEVTTATLVKLFTHDSTNHVIVRDVILTQRGTGGGQLGVYVQGPGNFYWLTLDPAPKPSASIHYDLRQELRQGEELWLQTGTGGATCLVTGYVFTTP